METRTAETADLFRVRALRVHVFGEKDGKNIGVCKRTQRSSDQLLESLINSAWTTYPRHQTIDAMIRWLVCAQEPRTSKLPGLIPDLATQWRAEVQIVEWQAAFHVKIQMNASQFAQFQSVHRKDVRYVSEQQLLEEITRIDGPGFMGKGNELVILASDALMMSEFMRQK